MSGEGKRKPILGKLRKKTEKVKVTFLTVR